MPQNPLTNKLSPLIGIILLISIIAFTVFINLDTKKEAEKITKIEEEVRFEPFDITDIANFWKLENLRTDSINVDYIRQQTYMQINKYVKKPDYFLLKDSILFDGMSSYAKDKMKKFYKLQTSTEEFTINYGVLIFKHITDKSEYYDDTFENFEIDHLDSNHIDHKEIFDIGNIILKYQINSININVEYGNFTCITLKDGRQIFLIKKDTEIQDKYYKELLKEAKYINDSTKIILPL